jgi:hypothetical protein
MADGQPGIEDRADPNSAASANIVYVMGAGRSGSTILGILLGNGADLFYAGELDAWIRRQGVANGDTPALAEFWSPVAEEMGEWLEAPAPDFFTAFEHPRGMLTAGALGRRVTRSAYQRYNRSLYAAILRRSGASWVVDSSHFPLRRWNLRGTEGLEIRTIMLVRDPRTVAAAFRKPVQKPKGFWGAASYLWVVHLLSLAVYVSIPRRSRLRVRYEDLVARPADELHRIGAWLGVDLASVDPEHLVPGPVFQGNRMRTQPVVTVARSQIDGDGAGLAMSLVMAPWILVLGYGRRRRRGQP